MSQPNPSDGLAPASDHATPSRHALPMNQEALEALPFPLSIYTSAGVYAGANALVEQLYHVPKELIVDVFNILEDATSRENGNTEAFLAARAGVRSVAPTYYYDFFFPGTRNPSRPGCWIETTYFPFSSPEGNITHVGALFNDVSDRVSAENQLQTFVALTENATDGISATDLHGRFTYANSAYQEMTGYGADLIGMPLNELYVEDTTVIEGAVQTLQETGAWRSTLIHRRKDGSTFPVAISAFVMHDRNGAPSGFGAISRDLTEERRVEQERLMLQEQIISAQEATLRELSTPLIPLANGVVVMPLIGGVDSMRAQQVIETLLTGVSELRARTVILDITGVSVVDTQVANGLLRAAQAVRLLGASVVLTGIRPEVAQTLVQLGVDLSGIITRSTLQGGVAFALKQ